jgi:CDP-diacylglycerol--glycerol-3-phosphate 3-phosphatidyltransferase
MLACEFHERSPLGCYLNEIGDVLSDAALYAPFARVTPFGPLGVALLIALSIMTEFAGALGPAVGASRRYDGPMGKGDRAVVFGALGLWVGCSAPMPAWLGWAMPTVVALLAVTAINRVHAGIREAESTGSPKC